ncbi:MAG TPA: hypothetical protein VER12_17090 [Polyangiaceae bacterium]|nr:hypothetical protein [Polyangiaceae bacterium]HYQ25627.1 hypothetical protein [Polyangiaceae bacterium]
MANRLMPLAGLCALHLLCTGCSADRDSESTSAAGSGGVASQPGAEMAGESAGAGSSSVGGTAAASGAPAAGGSATSVGSAGRPDLGEGGGAPASVDGQSVYALACHGDSKDCNLASVPCFGISSQTPNVAAGWACSNRCTSNADCSTAPSGAEARASCVSFTSAKHCMLVCRNENQSFGCPDGMACYAPPKSPIGYCLWQ